MCWLRKKHDAEIVSPPIIVNDEHNYYVKMKGVTNSHIFSAKDILFKFHKKFSQTDIRNVAIAHERRNSYRYKIKCFSESLAIIHDSTENRDFQIDLTDVCSAMGVQLEQFSPQDILKLGVQIERVRNMENSKLARNLSNARKTDLRVIK